jgi:predicted DNA-binding transcriptional regulator AlpA
MSVEKLLDKRAILLTVPVSGPTLERKIREGTFPAPVRIGTRTRRWFETDVLAWWEALRQERDNLVREREQRRERKALQDEAITLQGNAAPSNAEIEAEAA